MKRHADLRQLPRKHEIAPKRARDARRAAESATAGGVAALAQRVVQAFAAELDPHFRVEAQAIPVHPAQTRLPMNTACATP